jgi:hypothetical protein
LGEAGLLAFEKKLPWLVLNDVLKKAYQVFKGLPVIRESPGGSGLLHQILASWQEVLVEAQRFCQACEGQCASSCIDCLRTFRNAFYHEHLNRHVALTTLAKCAGDLHEEHQIPGQQPETSPSTANELPVNEAEDLLLDYLLSAGLPKPECQRSIPLPRPFQSTTPDFYYADDQAAGICIYLDGLSSHIHGKIATQQRDRDIRLMLDSLGFEVFSVPYTHLFDREAIRRFLVKIARALIGRDAASGIAGQSAWYESARAEELRRKAKR